MYHLYQGPLGAILVLGFGVVVSLFYWRFRQVWPVMVAHMLADAAALT
jgi:membrane protease YdiL (CAAX protease family)